MPEKKEPVTVGEAWSLITDKRTGKYPYDSDGRQELFRSLNFASKVWGATTPWTDIEPSHYEELLRRRLDELLAKGALGIRATEITLHGVIRTVIWLRDVGRIPRTAAQWPPRKQLKAEITRYWKGVTKETRDPQPRYLQHTLEEAREILKKSTFDPRFELLMWLGMDLVLGQVARARRSDLELPFGGHSFGTLTVYGGGKTRDGKPRQEIVELDAGQRAVIDRMLAAGGYLHRFEERYRTSGIDYLLFPTGYIVNRVGLLRNKDVGPLALSPKANVKRHVTGSWIRKNFRVAEHLAGVKHIEGRSTLGLRRGSEAHPSVSSARRQALRGELAAATTPAMMAADTPPDFTPLASDAVMAAMLQRRWTECVRCARAKAELAATVMMGGLLEALLVARANCMTDKDPLFKTRSAPLDPVTRDPRPLQQWTLANYIDVAHDMGWITRSAKDVAVVLRDYRNYVHPQKEWAHAITLKEEDSVMFWELTKTLAKQLLKSVTPAVRLDGAA